MTDIRDVRLLYAKGALFVLGGVVACALILLEQPSIKVTLLLAIAIQPKAYPRCQTYGT